MRNYWIYLLFCVLLLTPVSINAEVIILKSGKALEGKVIENTDQGIKVDVLDTGSIVTLLPGEIDTIKPDTARVCPLSVTHLLSSNKELLHIISLMFSAVYPNAQSVMLTPEDARWPLLYYYRNKDSNNLTTYLSTLLSDPSFLTDADQVYFARFFSVAFKEAPEKIDQVRLLKSTVGKVESEWLDSVISGIRDFKSLQPDTVVNIELLWADFRATGDTEIVKKILSVLTLSQSNENAALMNKTEVSLVSNSLRNVDIKDIIEKEKDALGEIAKPKIEAILFIINSLTELAGVYQYRGYNYVKLKQDNEAFAAYQTALRICPDYAIALNSLGNFYARVKHDRQRYLLYIKSAVYNDPTDPSYAYNLGIYFFENHQYDEAIKYYSSALEYEPNKPEYHHALARAYQEKGDADNAVKYFQQYLTLAPHGEHEQLVKAYLNSVRASVPMVTTDADVMLRQGRYEELDKYFESLLRQNERDENGLSRLANEVEQLVKPKAMGVPLEERLDIMNKWIKTKPESHFANLVLGRFYSDYAWEARGSGFSGTVIEKGWDLFRERLLKAQEYLAKAYDLNPSDAIAPANMLNIALGLGFEFAEMEQWFQRAIKADPHEYKAYTIKLKYLMPKWHGSVEQMFAFARDSAKKAPPRTLIPVILAEAHWEMYWRDDSRLYFKNNPDVWREVKDIYARVLRDFPNANYHRNNFALAAYYAGDFATARDLFVTIGDNWDSKVWKNKKSFESKRDEVK